MRLMKKILGVAIIISLALVFNFSSFAPAFAQTGTTTSTSVGAATTTTYKNLGFLQGNIWYSKDPFYDGDKIRVYTAIFNSSVYDLLGTAEFYDNDKPIGKMDFSVASGGKLKEVWADWQATLGNHKISARIVKAQISKVGTQTETIIIASAQTGADERLVDLSPAKKAELEKLEQSQKLTEEEPIKTEFATTATADKIISDAKNLFGTSTQEAAQKMLDFAFGKVEPAFTAINNFADSKAQKIEVKKEEIKKEIGRLSAKTPTTTPDVVGVATTSEAYFTLDSPFKSAYLFLLTILGLFFKYKVAFYLVSALFLYKILKFLYKIIFLRGKTDNYPPKKPKLP